jgi:succinate dehydrogenase/fumarate reductase flavoprotein subunit
MAATSSREAVLLAPGIAVLERAPAVELLCDAHGACAGAVLLDLERRRPVLARAGTTVLATGCTCRASPPRTTRAPPPTDSTPPASPGCRT